VRHSGIPQGTFTNLSYPFRDIKPHNFVLTSSAHLLLIDFGSSAPLLPASSSGAQQVPKPYCLLPCGTCDYISPEILQAHEEALVAAETGEEVVTSMDEGGYGRETDWWSLGAMMYELACGVAPFFAPEVRQTYMKIVNHEVRLKS
jgi:serine/threonine protein kinase